MANEQMSAFKAALCFWDADNPASLEWADTRNARRAAFALMWFVENVPDDAPDRDDIFFEVRSIYRACSAGTPLLKRGR